MNLFLLFAIIQIYVSATDCSWLESISKRVGDYLNNKDSILTVPLRNVKEQFNIARTIYSEASNQHKNKIHKDYAQRNLPDNFYNQGRTKHLHTTLFHNNFNDKNNTDSNLKSYRRSNEAYDVTHKYNVDLNLYGNENLITLNENDVQILTEKREPSGTSKRSQNRKHPKISKQHFVQDPVLNLVNKFRYARRKVSDTSSSSSSRELQNWKDEWKEHWVKKKFEAINSTQHDADVVNMVAARPWGVPCGDPKQHDMPWGSCTLPMECEAEYRIYRGDYFCGRSKFVCCALTLTSYDLYQAFDVSFADSALDTDSNEKKNNNVKNDAKNKRKKEREKAKRYNERVKRKKRIKSDIKKIVREIKRILNKASSNGTLARKKRTKQLKKFIKELKKKYKSDREIIRDVHEIDLFKIDEEVKKKLLLVKDVNKNFLSNSTFRDIVINGTVTKAGARMLIGAYPEFEPYLRMAAARRNNDDEIPPQGQVDQDDPSQSEPAFDIEYGILVL